MSRQSTVGIIVYVLAVTICYPGATPATLTETGAAADLPHTHERLGAIQDDRFGGHVAVIWDAASFTFYFVSVLFNG